MPQQNINYGVTANDGTGDTLRNAAIKINSNFTETYQTSSLAYAQANSAAQTIPQNAQTANYILTLSDAGKFIYYNGSQNTTLFIPTTANVAFSNGTVIMIVSETSSSANVTINANSGVSLYLAGNTTSSNRNVTTFGVATLLHVKANTWFVYGTGIV
jgi:hypothetical protein